MRSASNTEPTEEDREWFRDIAGKKDVMGVLRDVWANYRDESFIAQFLSPTLMRQMRMFHLHDDPARGHRRGTAHQAQQLGCRNVGPISDVRQEVARRDDRRGGETHVLIDHLRVVIAATRQMRDEGIVS